MSPDTAPFADLVAARMKERGVGLRQLCRAVELDPSFFSKVLAKKRNPPSEESVLRRIAQELELDAPRMIVAAGRVPSEWHRLWADAALFDSVHGLVTGGAPVSAPAANRWPRREPVRREALPRKVEVFGEELL